MNTNGYQDHHHEREKIYGQSSSSALPATEQPTSQSSSRASTENGCASLPITGAASAAAPVPIADGESETALRLRELTLGLATVQESLRKELHELINDQHAAGWPDLLATQMQLSEMKRIAARLFTAVEQADLNVTAASFGAYAESGRGAR